ncbi:hypothetical protein DICPUDRAFT_155154 [Dictyostelium purpureum]|uniref:Histidine kinase n=1 Tax=Dictyostelium purpureum TaxID=5786 RepID=F0ZT77_DICPU|nr:uncharacterized protein DICPUDRAFT_155154 [Dictyostelium purpureum]EGC32836.1 hypothetical protein DICPUDRAFT_155154 [Dictyostelium purpureum]|eukprot:XP_003290621.1 hypothetical protein DICPUDRAFT_155154 [Dictyostelium purpureum]
MSNLKNSNRGNKKSKKNRRNSPPSNINLKKKKILKNNIITLKTKNKNGKVSPRRKSSNNINNNNNNNSNNNNNNNDNNNDSINITPIKIKNNSSKFNTPQNSAYPLKMQFQQHDLKSGLDSFENLSPLRSSTGFSNINNNNNNNNNNTVSDESLLSGIPNYKRMKGHRNNSSDDNIQFKLNQQQQGSIDNIIDNNSDSAKSPKLYSSHSMGNIFSNGSGQHHHHHHHHHHSQSNNNNNNVFLGSNNLYSSNSSPFSSSSSSISSRKSMSSPSSLNQTSVFLPSSSQDINNNHESSKKQKTGLHQILYKGFKKFNKINQKQQQQQQFNNNNKNTNINKTKKTKNNSNLNNKSYYNDTNSNYNNNNSSNKKNNNNHNYFNNTSINSSNSSFFSSKGTMNLIHISLISVLVFYIFLMVSKKFLFRVSQWNSNVNSLFILVFSFHFIFSTTLLFLLVLLLKMKRNSHNISKDAKDSLSDSKVEPSLLDYFISDYIFLGVAMSGFVNIFQVNLFFNPKDPSISLDSISTISSAFEFIIVSFILNISNIPKKHHHHHHHHNSDINKNNKNHSFTNDDEEFIDDDQDFYDSQTIDSPRVYEDNKKINENSDSSRSNNPNNKSNDSSKKKQASKKNDWSYSFQIFFTRIFLCLSITYTAIVLILNSQPLNKLLVGTFQNESGTSLNQNVVLSPTGLFISSPMQIQQPLSTLLYILQLVLLLVNYNRFRTNRFFALILSTIFIEITTWDTFGLNSRLFDSYLYEVLVIKRWIRAMAVGFPIVGILLDVYSGWLSLNQSVNIIDSQNIQVVDKFKHLNLKTKKGQQKLKLNSQFYIESMNQFKKLNQGNGSIVSLLYDTDVQPNQKAYLERCTTSNEQLTKLTNECLYYSEIKQLKKHDIENLNFVLSDFLEDLISTPSIRTQFEEKEIDLFYLIDKEVPTNLIGDFKKIKTILLRLLSNSIKATYDGEVYIKVSLSSNKKLLKARDIDDIDNISDSSDLSDVEDFNEDDEDDEDDDDKEASDLENEGSDKSRNGELFDNIIRGNDPNNGYNGKNYHTHHHKNNIGEFSNSDNSSPNSHKRKKKSKTSNQIKLFFSVIDSGTGISPYSYSLLFEPFALSSTNVNSTEGEFGLGLPICNQLSKLMSGDISFVSEMEKGSIFELQVPLKKSEQLSHQFPRIMNPSSKYFLSNKWGEGLKILVIDDNPNIGQVIQMHLEPFGFKVYQRCTYSSAIYFFNENNGDFNLILLDPLIPNLNIQEIKQMKQDPTNIIKNTPLVLMCTTKNKNSLNVQGVHYLYKPIKREQLILLSQLLPNTSTINPIYSNQNIHSSNGSTGSGGTININPPPANNTPTNTPSNIIPNLLSQNNLSQFINNNSFNNSNGSSGNNSGNNIPIMNNGFNVANGTPMTTTISNNLPTNSIPIQILPQHPSSQPPPQPIQTSSITNLPPLNPILNNNNSNVIQSPTLISNSITNASGTKSVSVPSTPLSIGNNNPRPLPHQASENILLNSPNQRSILQSNNNINFRANNNNTSPSSTIQPTLSPQSLLPSIVEQQQQQQQQQQHIPILELPQQNQQLQTLNEESPNVSPSIKPSSSFENLNDSLLGSSKNNKPRISFLNSSNSGLLKCDSSEDINCKGDPSEGIPAPKGESGVAPAPEDEFRIDQMEKFSISSPVTQSPVLDLVNNTCTNNNTNLNNINNCYVTSTNNNINGLPTNTRLTPIPTSNPSITTMSSSNLKQHLPKQYSSSTPNSASSNTPSVLSTMSTPTTTSTVLPGTPIMSGANSLPSLCGNRLNSLQTVPEYVQISPRKLNPFTSSSGSGGSSSPQINGNSIGSNNESSQPNQTIANNNVNILLVEDNPVNAKIAMTVLRKHNFKVELSSHGQIAMERIKANHSSFDLILMDIHMPVMDGITCSKLIRKFEHEHSLKKLPIIALTADTSTGHKNTCLEAGCNEFMSKPLDYALLINLLKKLIVK